MPARPNFTEVRLKGGKVTALGVSNSEDLDDIVGIQVVVRQEAKTARGAAKLASGFEVQVPLFVNTGDKIEVDTRTGEYRRRV